VAFVDQTGGRVITNAPVPVRVTLVGACKTGDLLGLSAGAWMPSAGSTVRPPLLVAGTPGNAGDVIPAYPWATIDFGSGSTGIVGLPLYASDAPFGGYTATSPADPKIVGVLLTPQVAQIDLPDVGPTPPWGQAATMGNRTLTDADTLPQTVGHLNRLIADLQARGYLG